VTAGGVFVTGGNGFLGSYAVDWLLEHTDRPLFLLVRGKDRDAARARLESALRFHRGPEALAAVRGRWEAIPGDLHAPGLGLAAADRERIVSEADSVLHVAASLNRKSDKACFNTNLRGTLSVVKLAMAIADRGRLRRFTDVSTVAVAGHRHGETVTEDQTIDWGRSDYDPYARTKKFAEHLAHELLPPKSVVVLRPSTVMGDSRRERCWQTDMIQAFAGLSELPVIPVDPRWRIDVAPGDWVGTAIGELHHRDDLAHDAYNLSAGAGSATYGQIAAAMADAGRRFTFQPRLAPVFDWTVRGMNRLPRGGAQRAGALLKVFWPYITYDTVFDNTRAVSALGRAPARFESYCAGMYRYSRSVGYRNPEPASV
jgi:thioester reductase-like protein